MSELTKEEKLEKLLARKAKLKNAAKIAEVDAEISALVGEMPAQEVTGELPPSEIKPEETAPETSCDTCTVPVEFSKTLYFPEPFWSDALKRSFEKGVYKAKDEQEVSFLEKFSVSKEKYYTIL